MSEPAEVPKHQQLRASDADRERVANLLHQAVGEGRLTIDELDERLQGVYQAKTLGDLVPFTADLPVAATATTPVPVAGPAPVQRIGGTPSGNTSFAMLSGFDRSGAWVVPRYYSAIAVLGGGELDLTQAKFAEGEATIQVFALLGGVEIIVPDDITVRIHGIGIMGGFEHRAAHEAPPGAPILNINGLALLGGVDVRPPKGKRNKPMLDR